MKGIVWGKTFASAVDRLDQIAIQYEQLHINPIRITKSRTEYIITYENGDYWRACCVNTSSRGYKSNISYIDMNIPNEIIETIILPCTTSPSYQGIIYYQ